MNIKFPQAKERKKYKKKKTKKKLQRRDKMLLVCRTIYINFHVLYMNFKIKLKSKGRGESVINFMLISRCKNLMT